MDKNEALAEAIERGVERGRFDYAAVERLLHEGASARGRLWGASLLHALAQSDAAEACVVARALLGFGADPDEADARGATALCVAARAGNAAVARELTRGGASPRLADHEGEDAMRAALERVDEEMVGLLLEAGYPARGCKDSRGRPALVCVADHPRAAGVAFELMHRGADPEEADAEGWTPLAMAARAGVAPMVSMLISEGARPMAPGPAGLAPFAIALGARPGACRPGGSRVGPGHMACALRLARHMPEGWGAAPDAGGWPPLARLCRSIARFEPSWMEKLEEAGADPRAAGPEGWGLLRLAAEVGDEAFGIDLARWAMARGADPERRCDAGVAPDEAALREGKWALHELLRSERELGELEASVGSGSASGRSGRL